MSEIVAIKPPPLPPIACPQGGCHGVVSLEWDAGIDPVFACTKCTAEWTHHGSPIVQRYDCLTCGAVNIQPRGHDCAPFLKQGVGS